MPAVDPHPYVSDQILTKAINDNIASAMHYSYHNRPINNLENYVLKVQPDTLASWVMDPHSRLKNKENNPVQTNKNKSNKTNS